MVRLTPVRRLLLGGAAAVLLPVVGVTVYVTSEDHGRHDPAHALQQLDLLYLDEPAPSLAAVGAPPGRVAVLLFCDGCDAPRLERAAVVRVEDRAVARQYGLGAGDRAGWALVDRRGHVRYRSYDPHVGDHAVELQTMVDGLPS